MVNYQGAPLQEQVKQLLEKNLEYSKEIYTVMKKIQRYIMLGRILSIIYIILIVGPLILGLIYLPGIFKNTLNTFLPGSGKTNNLEQLLEEGGLLDQYQGILNLQNN